MSATESTNRCLIQEVLIKPPPPLCEQQLLMKKTSELRPRAGVYRKMGSCRGVSPPPHRSRYVSWCVSAEPPAAAAPTDTGLRGKITSRPSAETDESLSSSSPGEAPGPVPLLLLSPPEASGGEASIQPAMTKRTHHKAFEGRRQGNTGDPSPLHPQDEGFLLPRSSLVVSRGHRPISWHGGGTDASAPPSSDSGSLAASSLEDLDSGPGSCQPSSRLPEDKKPHCVSVASSLNRLLSAGLHRPFGRQQGLAEEHRGRGMSSCDAPQTSGVSTSKQHSKQRRCSGIPEFSADILKTSCELDKENAHFVVVDMVLEVLESAKWTLRHTQRHTHCSTCTLQHTCTAEEAQPREHTQRFTAGDRREDNDKHRRSGEGNTHTHQHTQDEEEEEEVHDEAEHQPKTFSVLSTDSGFEDCGVDTTPTLRDSLRNAECLAQLLVLEFRRSWLPSHGPRRGRLSLRSSLQELPGTGGVAVSSSSLADEIRLRTRMRGSLSWAPPRVQIIFTVQPSRRRSEVVALQNFLCAGCGTEVEPKYIKKLRYCEYLGRYFCDCCHSGCEAVIPGRLLSGWDFSRYPVSDFSKQLLDSVWHQPLFDLSRISKTLSSKVRELDKFRELQEQLLDIKKLLTKCRLSGRVMPQFGQLPAHLTEQPHLFSMDDLYRVKKCQLVAQARAVLHAAINHVENCELCLARGFICEFCRRKDVIFPFQSDICRRCPVCKACFHKHCFVEKKCPKCARIQTRSKRPDGSTK